MDRGSMPSAAGRQTHIDAAMDQLGKNVIVLVDLISEVKDKLVSVMREPQNPPSLQETVKASPQEEIYQTPLAGSIFEKATKVSAANTMLSQILQRLEL